LSASVGLLVAIRLNAAVRWDWFPMLRHRLRPRLALLISTLGVAALATFAPLAAVACGAAVTALTAFEVLWLLVVTADVRRRVMGPSS
jgi:hypothetical protein